MDYTFYLKSRLWCKVFLKPDSVIFKKFPKDRVFNENDKLLVSGYFTDVKVVSERKESCYGGLEKFLFVNKMDMNDFNNTNDQKYIYKINAIDIISIEMVFDEKRIDGLNYTPKPLNL